jgi:hypothetical protein
MWRRRCERCGVTSDRTLQTAVRGAVDEITGADERLIVTHTVATRGWGDVLYVDVYARSPYEMLDDEFDRELRKLVSVVSDTPFERIAVRWRISS